MKQSPALWAIAGAAVAALVVPTAASAVSTALVSIADSATGATAYVDSGHRLHAAETSLGNIRTITADGVTSCRTVFTVPAGRTLVIKDVYATPQGQGGQNSEVGVYANAACSGASIAQGTVSQAAGGVATNAAVDLGPGAVVAAGKPVSVISSSNFVDVHIYGYLV